MQLTSSPSFHAYEFLCPPVLKRPPETPLPEDLGEVMIHYPGNNAPFPSQLGHVYRAKCALRVIMNEISEMSFPDFKMTLVDADWFYSRLKAWSHNLPDEVSPSKIVLPGHFQIQ